MTLAQEHVVAGPDAVIMWLFGGTAMIVIMIMVVVMVMVVVMGMTTRMIVTVQGVVVRHADQSSALPL